MACELQRHAEEATPGESRRNASIMNGLGTRLQEKCAELVVGE